MNHSLRHLPLGYGLRFGFTFIKLSQPNATDALVVGFDDFKLQAFEFEFLSDGRHVAEFVDQQPRHRCEVVGFDIFVV